MRITESELRRIIREEIEEEMNKWPAAIPNLAALKALSPATLQAITNRSEWVQAGKKKTKVELGPELDGSRSWPQRVSYPGKTAKAPRLEVEWESADQYRDVRHAVNGLVDPVEKKHGTAYSRQVAWEYATGKRF